ncbi:DNA replication complex GINS protein PSF2 [Tritrichomonas musculus]|uniref:DNA replication complex GINS protein PSF2 n=1 Tax=Tritrichomonas musculus TaxID=1915356 RepID=A0ABR2LBE3_9EUKA
MSVSWSPEELTFIAENSKINITPHFTADKIKLLSGEFGPFTAGYSTKIPLWLALFLYSSQLCDLIPPEWLNTSYLKKWVEKERQDKETLSKLPKDYMEISFTFFNRASSIISDCDQVKDLINRLWELRIEKIRKTIGEQSSETIDQYQFPNITQMELYLFREPISRITTLLTSLNECISPVDQSI